jgi:hypothetical protein
MSAKLHALVVFTRTEGRSATLDTRLVPDHSLPSLATVLSGGVTGTAAAYAP